MPAQSEATTKYGQQTAQQFGYGPFGQLMTNLGVVPTPMAELSPSEISSIADRLISKGGLINVTAEGSSFATKPSIPRTAEQLIENLKNPRQISGEAPFYHGTQIGNRMSSRSSLEELLKSEGLRSGWFARDPTSVFGPLFLKAQFKDIPQPLLFRHSPFYPVDPPIEYIPNWRGGTRFGNEDYAYGIIKKALKELSDATEYEKQGNLENAEAAVARGSNKLLELKNWGGSAVIPFEKLSPVDVSGNPTMQRIWSRLMRLK